MVLDEADRMLDMGFIDDMKFILFYVNEDRQTVFVLCNYATGDFETSARIYERH